LTIIGLYSDSQILGGAERSLLTLAAAYRGSAELVVCSPHPQLVREASRIEGVHTRQLRVRTSHPGSVLDHRREFRDLGLDLLQVTLCNPFGSRTALLGGVLARIPTLTVEQLVFPSRRRRGRVLKRALARMQSGTIAVGTASADDLHRHFGLPRTSMTVVHNGVPDRQFVDRRSSGQPVVGCAARLEDQKGVDVLVRALLRVPDANLVLVGDGECRAALERLVAELNLADRVKFMGWRDDAPRQIASFDVFALASRNEAFPLTIVEAMLAGTPVVASDVGSVSEAIIDDVTGLLVPSGDEAALAHALRRLLGDAALRRRLATAAREHALAHFTDVTMADRYDQVWQAVLERSGSSKPTRRWS
jgi:glycosyltransferase involved in cell wall biosynthesis